MVAVEKRAVPELRFPGFTKEWNWKKLNDVADLTSSKRIFLSDYVPSGVPFFRGKEISQLKNKTALEDVLYIPVETYNEIKTQYGVPEVGDLLITAVGTLGNVFRVADKLNFYFKDGNLIWFRNVLEDSRYLELNLNAQKSRILKSAIGSSQKALTIVELKKLLYSFPSFSEQQKIADFLGAVDDRLTALQRKSELLQVYKRGMMQKIFSRELRFKCDDGSDFPDWEERRLGEVAERCTQKNSDCSISRVLTNSATQGIVDQRDYFDKDIANADNLGGYYIVGKGDYVYNPRISVHAPVGPIKKNLLGKGIMSPLYTVFRFNDRIDEFFEQYFRSTFWHKYMCSVANYGARYDRMNITTKDFMAIPLPWPHCDEQQKIANFLSAIDTKIESVGKQIEQVETFKKGLLQKMFV